MARLPSTAHQYASLSPPHTPPHVLALPSLSTPSNTTITTTTITTTTTTTTTFLPSSHVLLPLTTALLPDQLPVSYILVSL
ncbi:hypothetical protein E2C01_064709 [Portunus trituberculatus]|uniref:Uncharacterized protein n=1 Tax=Portunus trituberculatus TaxID=210409 RepID=A0A5B7HDS3_PORTR|nr:hypothetical protein [Portunus trituberculatus]